MNRFGEICETCPLRSLCDVDAATETQLSGEVRLADGDRTCTVHLRAGGVADERSASFADEKLAGAIKNCDKPTRITGGLRRSCDAGLGSVWSWKKPIGVFTPDIPREYDFSDILRRDSRLDAIAPPEEPVWAMVSGETESRLVAGSAFVRIAGRRMAQDVRGNRGEVR